MITRRALIVCTANVCRSPTVERLLQRRLEGLVDLDGARWVVRSAGTSSVQARMDRHTIAAAAQRGIDLTGHTSRPIERAVLAADGADLIITMTREHLRTVVGHDPALWTRTFTLKELARRAGEVAPPSAGEGFAGWRRRVADGRRASEMLRPDPADDVADPYGGPRREHDAMIDEVSALVDRLVELGPWRPSDGPSSFDGG